MTKMSIPWSQNDHSWDGYDPKMCWNNFINKNTNKNLSEECVIYANAYAIAQWRHKHK